jgi:GT2 family glycosyltransferase
MINIFILNWRSVDKTKNCLKYILSSKDQNFRIVLINNFSEDSDIIELKNIYSYYKEQIEIYLVENTSNLGYAGGNNSGFRFIEEKNLSGDILILNPDILVSSDTIGEMRKALAYNVGIVTPRTLNTNGEILYDAIKLTGFLQRKIVSKNTIVCSDYSQGACMLISREVLRKVGLFDERFFLYWEEVDFSLRVREKGYKLVSVTSARVIREKNPSVRQPLSFYYSIRNARLIKTKHPKVFSNFKYVIYLGYMLLLIFKYSFRPTYFVELWYNYFSGLRDSFRNKYYFKASVNAES